MDFFLIFQLRLINWICQLMKFIYLIFMYDVLKFIQGVLNFILFFKYKYKHYNNLYSFVVSWGFSVEYIWKFFFFSTTSSTKPYYYEAFILRQILYFDYYSLSLYDNKLNPNTAWNFSLQFVERSNL